MYFCMAVSMLYLGSGVPGIGAWGRRGIALLLIIGILLMASKLAWLALLFLVVHILIARWRDAVIRREALSVLVGFVLALIALLSFSEFAAERIREMKAAIAEKSVDRRTETSSGLRLIAWEAAAEVIKAAPLIGAGTGDVKDELMDHYEEQGYSSAFEQKLNAHSQYLQSWAALGLIGLIALVASLIVPLYNAILESDHLSTSFLGLLLLNLSVESLIEVQAGVVFMAIVAWCLVMRTERSSHP